MDGSLSSHKENRALLTLMSQDLDLEGGIKTVSRVRQKGSKHSDGKADDRMAYPTAEQMSLQPI
jgi:hypothetical protein